MGGLASPSAIILTYIQLERVASAWHTTPHHKISIDDQPPPCNTILYTCLTTYVVATQRVRYSNPYPSVDIIATPPPLVDSAGNFLALKTPHTLAAAGAAAETAPTLLP